jgi:hypothetical protein
VFWRHPDTGELHDSAVGEGGIMYGASSGINSYVGHEFEVREIPSKSRGCPKKTGCRKTKFVVSGDEDQGERPRER